MAEVVSSSPSAPAKAPRVLLVIAIVAFCIAGASAAALLVLSRGAASNAAATLPDLGTIPEFALTNQDGAAFGTQQLRGKVWIANFIFTRCPTVCPLFTRKMAQVQTHTSSAGTDLQLVSFSVDPDYDQPPVLKAYAEKNHADASRWTFLTGKPDALKTVVVDGLKQLMGREGPSSDFNSIFHGTHFVLIDRAGHIRGYYRSEDDDVIERLSADALALAKEGTPQS